MSDTKPVTETAENFFVKDRGERAAYVAAAPDADIVLPVTRDGFEALLELAAAQYNPPLPVNDSMRSVVAGWVHHLEIGTTSTTIKKVGGIMFRSISNALTWTIDQEVKKKRQDEAIQFQAKMKVDADEAARAAAAEKRALKSEKKATKYSAKKLKANEKEAN